MIRAWLAIILIVLGVAAARAIPVEQQIIIFGGQSSASGSSIIPDCANPTTGQIDLSVCSNTIYVAIGVI